MRLEDRRPGGITLFKATIEVIPMPSLCPDRCGGASPGESSPFGVGKKLGMSLTQPIPQSRNSGEEHREWFLTCLKCRGCPAELQERLDNALRDAQGGVVGVSVQGQGAGI